MVQKTANTEIFREYEFVKKLTSFLLPAISFFIFFLPGSVNAQTVYDLVAKGDAVEQLLELQNTSGAALTNPDIEVVLPAGVSLYPGSMDLMNTGLTTGATYSLIGNAPSGFIIRINGVFPNGETAQIRFKRTAGCVTQQLNNLRDEAFVVSSSGVRTSSNPYSIWEPVMYPTSASSVPAGSAIAGQDVIFSYSIWNSGLNSYVSNIIITIHHAGFDTPTEIVLVKNANTVSIGTSDITIIDGNSMEFQVTSAMLTALGLTDGRVYTNEDIGLSFKAVPKITSCGSSISMKISTRIDDCAKITSDSRFDIGLNVLSPGTVLSSFTAERTLFDFPDAGDTRTRNGAWSWDSGTASPRKDYVRNGDTLELRVKGAVYTSSLLPHIGRIYADIYAVNAANANTYSEFSWNPSLTVRVKDAQNSWTENVVIADVTDNSGFMRYKIDIFDNIAVESGGEVELVIAAVLKNTATDNTLCNFSADLYAAESSGMPANGYPTAACRNMIMNVPLRRVVLTDELKVETSAFTGSCAVETSSVKFTSAESSVPSVADENYFTQEFRANHYVKELQVYIPSEGTLQAGRITFDGGTSASLSLPSPTTVSFTANANTYTDARLYIFDVSALYGDYEDNSSKFRDEYSHELLFDFDVVYSNELGGTGQASSILYVATPVNPSAPNAILSPMSAVQTVLLPTISPELTVNSTPGSQVTISGGKATWMLTLRNPNESLALEDVSLELNNITSGSFSGLTVRLNGVPVTVSGSIAALGNIARNTTHTIEIEGIIDQACNETEEVSAVLRYEPCGSSPEEIGSVNLSFRAPTSTIQIAATPSSTNLEMCEDFTVKIIISASEGVVYDPRAVLVFPKNSSGAIGVTYKGVKIGGVDYSGPGITGGIEDVTFDLENIAGAPNQLEAGVPANNSFELDVILAPNCDFPINAKLVSYAYGRNYCNEYNSTGSGVPLPTDVLTIDGLQSAYTADVKFSETLLKLDKELNEKTATLSIKKSSAGGTVGANDVVSLTMPATLKLAAYPAGFISDNVQGTGADAVRVVTWQAPISLSSSEWVDYPLTFVMEDPAAHTDLLSGTISAVVVNKVTGLACGNSYCSDIETKAGETSLAFEIIDLFPGLAKAVSYTANSLLNLTFTYTFTLKNFGSLPINNIHLEDDLSEFYDKGTVSNISVSASSANLVANPSYNGKTNILLLNSSSQLLPNETQTVTLSFNIIFNDEWKNKNFTISNTAVFTGCNENGTEYEDRSNEGTEPDLTDNDPTITEPIDTNPPEVITVPIVNVPPPGFSIVTDGVECFEGNEGTTTPLEFEYRLKDGIPLDYDLCFTVYTRDSIATVSDNDYHAVAPVVICIDAGNVSASRTVTATIVGDDKYESDEPFILEIKPTTNEMVCTPTVINILNDDAIPTVTIKEITQPSRDTVVANVGELYQRELTSPIQRTEFWYSVMLSMAAPQDLVLRVVVGNENDTATEGRDYYVSGDIIVNIPTGAEEARFMIEVEPDDIPENHEFFTMSFSLEAGGVVFHQEMRRSYIIDDDKLYPSNLNDALTYCPTDDAVERLRKLDAYIAAPAGYELRWYANQTSGSQISEPLMETAQPGDAGTFYLGYYNPSESYETPDGERVAVMITVQSKPPVSITSTPAAPMTLYPGQTVLITATPGLASYDFTLNGTAITSGATSSNEVRVHQDKFIANTADSYAANTVGVTVEDSEGCLWSDSFNLDVKQVELPNAFIPDGDNDANKVFLKDYNIKVFNRWGHLLYQGSDGWDGRYKGSYVAPGTYYYVLNMQQDDGSIVEVKGYVMVVGADKK